jgi:LPXTG-motif cell wall-anchored protein
MAQRISLSRRGVRGRSATLAVAGTMIAVLGALTVATSVGATGLKGHLGGGGPHKVTLCRATGNAENPYAKVEVDEDDAKKGHDGPVFAPGMGDKDNWGDVVPGGKNWSHEGMEVFSKGCVCPWAKPPKPEKPTPGTKPHDTKPPVTKPGGPTPTMPMPPKPTPTTAVKPVVQTPPTTVAGTLPITGSNSGLLAFAGLVLMGAGAGLLVLRQRTIAG